MKFNHERFYSVVKKNLTEMAMDLPPENEPHPDVTDKLAQGQTSFKPEILPQTGKEPEQNFQELLASERYKQVIQKLQDYTGIRVALQGMEGYVPIIQLVQPAFERLLKVEAAHREELEQLAVELVTKELGIPEGSFIFDVKITGLDMATATQPIQQPQQPEEEDDDINPEGEMDSMNRIINLDQEKAKRRLINSMVQGASKKGHFMYHYVSDRIAQITGSDTLLKDYGLFMSVNDSLYWQQGDEEINQIMNMQGGKAGQEEVDRNTEPPTIKAVGVCFPVLVHEIIKGVMEVFAVHGLPDEGAEEVLASEDTLEKEIWDIRLGPAIWDRVRNQFPEEILLDDKQKELQSYLLVAIFKLPAKDFLVFMKEVLTGTEAGKQFIAELMNGIRKSFNEEDYTPDVENLQGGIKGIADETDDNDLNDFLGSLGIGPAGAN